MLLLDKNGHVKDFPKSIQLLLYFDGHFKN